MENREENISEEMDIVVTSDQNSDDIQKIIERAVTDPEFKKMLMEEPDKVLDEYDISEMSRIMIKSLGEEDYAKLTPENIQEYFTADSAIYTPDFDDSIEVSYGGEDDI